MTTAARVDSDSPERLMVASRRFEAAARTGLQRASAAMTQVVDETEREVTRRRSLLNQAQRRLDQAQAGLRACLAAERGSCGREAEAVAAAERELRRRQEQMRIGESVRNAIRTKRDQFERECRSYAAQMEGHLESGRSHLVRAQTAIDAYLRGAPPTAAGVRAAAGTGAASNASASLAAQKGQIAFTEPKVERQIASRGWTHAEIRDAYLLGRQVPAVNKARDSGPATRYVHPKTGRSIVVDNETGEIIHVGKIGYRYGPGSGDRS